MKSGIAIQKERLLCNCKIKRIFVVNSKEEKESIKKVMSTQREAGIEVSWVLKENLLRSKVAKDCFKKIGTLDVAVVDNAWVYRTHLDSSRKIVSANATRNKNILEKASMLINEAERFVSEEI